MCLSWRLPQLAELLPSDGAAVLSCARSTLQADAYQRLGETCNKAGHIPAALSVAAAKGSRLP